MRERVEDELLDRPLDRPRPVRRVVALGGDERLRGGRELEVDLPILEPLGERPRLELDDRLELLLGQAVEDHDLVDPVEELRPELAAERIHDVLSHQLVVLSGKLADEGRAHVAGHDDDHVLEVDRAALTIGQPPIVEDLQEDVEDVGVGLLDLVEEQHGVRTPPHRLGELPALVVADVAGWSAHQPRDAVLLHVLAHVEPHHRLHVVEQELGEGLREERLADAGGAKEQE